MQIVLLVCSIVLHFTFCIQWFCMWFWFYKMQAKHMCWSHHSWITLLTHRYRIREMHTHKTAHGVHCLEAAHFAVELQMGCCHQSSQQDIWLSRCFHHGQAGEVASPWYPGFETPEKRRWKCVCWRCIWGFFTTDDPYREPKPDLKSLLIVSNLCFT